MALPSRSTSRSQTPAPSTSTSTTPRNRRPKPGTIITARRSKNGPPVGSFKCDPSKPYALVDGTGKSLVIFNPRKSRGAGSEIFDPWRTKERRLSSGSFRALTAAAGARSLECPQSSPVAQAALIDASPIYRSRTSITSLISSNANPMMSGLVSPATGLSLEAMAGEIVGPPEAFFPFIGVSTIGNPFSDDEDDRINDEDLMDLSEFIDFTGAESETEGDSDPTRLTATGQATPREHAGLSSYGTEISSDTKWLDHLTKRGLINVYRRDQQHKKSLQARRGRAFTMLPPEFNRKKAIKPGRHSIVISPVSPLHRRAPSNPWSSGVKKQSAGTVAVKRRHMPMPTVSQPHRHRRVQTAFY